MSKEYQIVSGKGNAALRQFLAKEGVRLRRIADGGVARAGAAGRRGVGGAVGAGDAGGGAGDDRGEQPQRWRAQGHSESRGRQPEDAKRF